MPDAAAPAAVAPAGASSRTARTRVAVAATFALNGALFGVWASRVPAVKGAFGLGEGELGLVLLALAAGAIASFPLAGAASGRIGAERLSRRLNLVYVGTFALLGAAVASGSTPALVVALALFGAAFGSLDVAMNGWGAEVERAADRPIMSGFHALFSLGAGLGAGTGYVAARVGLGAPVHFWIAAVACGALALAAVGRERPPEPPEPPGGARAGAAAVAGPLVALPRGPLLLVGLIALGTALGEGALADWSAIYLVEVAGATGSVAALGFAAFSAAMVALRLAGDRIVARLGPPATVRASAAVAFAGIALATLAPQVGAVLAGFALMGAGYAIVMPLAFSRAAADPHVAPGIAIAGVATLAYGGMLLGPPAIGALAELLGLRAALGTLAALTLLAFALARHVAPPGTSAPVGDADAGADVGADGAERLARQLDFLLAVDALKRVARASTITGGARRENSAEHSWHVALAARALAEHANAPVDPERVTAMLLVHDIVEIDAGDVPLLGPEDPDRHARESAAAARLFGLLPRDQGRALEALWREFESGDGIDARFARALDRLLPMLLNSVNGGGTWVEYAVTRERLVRRTGHVADGSRALWAHCERLIDEAVERGWVIDRDAGGGATPGGA